MEKTKQNILHFKSVYKFYQEGQIQVKALSDINISIEQGSFTAITGPSGSGKSTLLNLMSFIDKPSNGKIDFYGKDSTFFKENEVNQIRSKNVGIIFQNYNLIPVLNSLENVLLPLQLNSSYNDEFRDRGMKLLEKIGLGKCLKKLPGELSGGQKQRIAIARALISSPDFIVADEPTAALDSKTGEEIIELMKQINDDNKTAFIFSTHDSKIIKQAKNVMELVDGSVKNN